MRSAPPTTGADDDYDELAFLAENAEEAELPFDPAQPPAVRRSEVAVPSGGTVSALVWGDEPPRLALLHGGAQNAHTWDTTALALSTPLVALDLPGHGHSSWRPEGDYTPAAMADDVAAALGALAPAATTLVGMSLGGLTALAVLARHPGVAGRLALVDITPGVTGTKAGAIMAFVSGPAVFDSFDAILERTLLHNPTRSRSSLARGVRHNAKPHPDGTWSWRYDRPARSPGGTLIDPSELWQVVGSLPHPLLLARGSVSPVVSDGDVTKLRELRPDAEVVVVDGAGHSIQGDRPVELAHLLGRFHRS